VVARKERSHLASEKNETRETRETSGSKIAVTRAVPEAMQFASAGVWWAGRAPWQAAPIAVGRLTEPSAQCALHDLGTRPRVAPKAAGSPNEKSSMLGSKIFHQSIS